MDEIEYSADEIGAMKEAVRHYDNAIRSLVIARQKLLERDMDGRDDNINNAIDVIKRMSDSLNLNSGNKAADEQAIDLKNLYSLFLYYLPMADKKMIEEIKGAIEILRDSWNEVINEQYAGHA
jgi:flagellin-specific chaperone FliS